MSALTIPADIAPAVAARLWVAVDRAPGDGCWVHRTAARSGRRGIIDVASRDQYAYRVAWVLTNGPIPDGVLVCHHCDNPPCCRPDHLFLGSSKDNAQDAKRKGRLRLPAPRRGEASPAATARDVEVEEARRLYQAGGHTQAELAVRYGVAPSTMGRWMRGVARADVPVRKPPLPDACGSRAGYCRHQKRRETPCNPCRAANTAYLREYKAARRMRPGAVAA